MPPYQGSLFDANGPMQFANQVRGIADALDSVNEKATSFFQSTEQGLENLSQALNSFQGATGRFSPGGRGGGGGGYSAPSTGQGNDGGTGGQRGNTMGVGGSGNNPPDFQGQTGDTPNGGYSSFSAGKMVEAGLGTATGVAQRYNAQTLTASVQQQMAAAQGSQATGQPLSMSMRGIANNGLLASSQADLAIGSATSQNLFGVTMTGNLGGVMGANQTTIKGATNLVNLMSGGALGPSASEQALGLMMSNSALMAQQSATGMMFRRNGQYNSPESIVNALFQQHPELQTMDDLSFSEVTSPGSPWYQLISQMGGGDPSTLAGLIRARRNSGRALPTNITPNQAIKLNLTSPAAASQVQKQSAQSHAQAQLAQGQDQALTDFNKAMTSFYQSVNSLFSGHPNVAYGLGFGSTAAGFLGSPIGTAVSSFLGGGDGGAGGGGAAAGGIPGLGGGGGGMGGMGGIGGIAGPAIGLAALAAVTPLIAAKLPSLINDMSQVFSKAASGLGSDLGSAASSAGSAISSAGGWVIGGIESGLSDIGHFFSGGTASAQTSKPSGSSGGVAGTAGAATGGTSGPIGTSQQNALIKQSLQKAGIADTSANESAVNLIVEHESSWNANAQNNWDSNAKAGDPSRGLMQLIMTTFKQYAASGYNTNIFDPLSNLVAGERYAVSHYGSLTNVPGVKAVSQGKPYVGYETGSYEIERTKLALLHKGERVVRSADNTVSSRYGNLNGGGERHVHFHFASGAVSVTIPTTDQVTAERAGALVGAGILERLASA